MKTLFKIILSLGLLGLLAAAVCGVALYHGSAPDHQGFSIVINGDEGSWDSMDLEEWLGVGLGLGITGVVMAVLLPLILLLSVGLPLLIAGVVVGAIVLAIGGVGAVVFSPAFLLILFLWLVLRPKRRHPRQL